MNNEKFKSIVLGEMRQLKDKQEVLVESLDKIMGTMDRLAMGIDSLDQEIQGVKEDLKAKEGSGSKEIESTLYYLKEEMASMKDMTKLVEDQENFCATTDSINDKIANINLKFDDLALKLKDLSDSTFIIKDGVEFVRGALFEEVNFGDNDEEQLVCDCGCECMEEAYGDETDNEDDGHCCCDEGHDGCCDEDHDECCCDEDHDHDHDECCCDEDCGCECGECDCDDCDDECECDCHEAELEFEEIDGEDSRFGEHFRTFDYIESSEEIDELSARLRELEDKVISMEEIIGSHDVDIRTVKRKTRHL